jgi:signal transduction histidine kinase
MLERLIGDDVQLVRMQSPDLGTSKVDPVQVKQIIMNLVINSGDAMPHGGRVTVEAANVGVDETFAELHPFTTVRPLRHPHRERQWSWHGPGNPVPHL